jgi:hypothetical protein
MTLKEGRQREHFLAVLSRTRPDFVPRVESLYPGGAWGQAAGDYYRRIVRTFARLARAHRLLPRIPQALFRDLVRPEDLPVLILDQVHALREMLGEPSQFGRAAFELSRRGPAAAELDPESRRLAGEIARTGTARLYEDLLSLFSPGTAAAR